MDYYYYLSLAGLCERPPIICLPALQGKVPQTWQNNLGTSAGRFSNCHTICHSVNLPAEMGGQ